MLTFDELLGQVKQLTVEERVVFLEEIAHSLRGELSAAENEKELTSNEVPGTASLDRLYGILKTQESPPSDAEIQDGYIDYLSKKYA